MRFHDCAGCRVHDVVAMPRGMVDDFLSTPACPPLEREELRSQDWHVE
jgi:hypothetical protein